MQRGLNIDPPLIIVYLKYLSTRATLKLCSLSPGFCNTPHSSAHCGYLHYHVLNLFYCCSLHMKIPPMSPNHVLDDKKVIYSLPFFYCWHKFCKISPLLILLLTCIPNHISKLNASVADSNMSVVEPNIDMCWGFPQSGYAYSVIIGFLSSYPYPGWQHHSNTMSVYTIIQFKDHSGDPVVASGYFVDNCESGCLYVCVVSIFMGCMNQFLSFFFK